jgi:hypothetical protein
MANQVFFYTSFALLFVTGLRLPTSTTQLFNNSRTYQRRIQYDCRRRQQELQLPQRPPPPPAIEPSTPTIVLSRLDKSAGIRRVAAISNHLQNSSRQSYNTGFNHFRTFCSHQQLIPSHLLTWTITDIQRLFEFFIDYLRHSRIPVLQGHTINSYATHAADALTTLSIVPSTIAVRSANFANMITSYINADFASVPLLNRQMIPLTFALLCDIPSIVSSIFSDFPSLQQLVLTAFCLGYCLSLRPSEYADRNNNRTNQLAKQLTGKDSFFWFLNIPFNVCSPHLYPTNQRPDLFSSLLQYRKNDTRGKGTPLATARPSTPSPTLTCIDVLFDFLFRFPPLPNQLLLSGSPHLFSTELHIQPVLDALTVLHDLPPRRLRPHSSIRSGVLAQINDQPDEVKRRQGGWTSNSGMLIYTRPSFQHAITIANDIHDATKYPTTHLQHIFGSAPPPSSL